MTSFESLRSCASEDDLLRFVQTQRWFGAKGREVVGLAVVDEVPLRDDGATALDALVEVRYGAGTHDVYQLLVGLHEAEVDGAATIATGERGHVVEGLGDPSAVRRLIRLLQDEATVTGEDGSISFCRPRSAGDELAFDRDVAELSTRLVGVEQSNSSVIVEDTSILKAYRHLEAGVNPELELLRFLGAHGFEGVPELQGWWSYAGQAISATLGIVQRFVPDAPDGWSVALAELSSEPEAFLGRLEALGDTIGRLHVVLASEADDPAFAPEPRTPETLALFAATLDDEINNVFVDLPESEALAPIAGRGDAVRELLSDLTVIGSTGTLIRQHGDLHLGQVLLDGGRWLVIDFEGEPARTLGERRRKRSPLRDVAGMLRSFSYAVSVAGVPAELEDRARLAFVDGYVQAAQGASILPSSRVEIERLISIFELEKAIYELRYELSHRPDWVKAPVSGIVRLLEQRSA